MILYGIILTTLWHISLSSHGVCNHKIHDIQKQTMIDGLATDEISIDIAPDVHVIRYTITLSKKRNYDSLLWGKIIKATLLAAQRSRISQSALLEMLKEISNFLLEEQERNHERIVGGEIEIAMSDGIPSHNCCGDACTCIERYNGNCPCSLNQESLSLRCCSQTKEKALETCNSCPA